MFTNKELAAVWPSARTKTHFFPTKIDFKGTLALND